LEPDLAVVTLGVEVTAPTVADARRQAAEAMTDIITTVEARGVAERDVRTTSFNIFPQYEFIETMQNGRPIRKQVRVGYRVNNTASIKIRDMSDVGPTIDAVATAGGDVTRINGINFTVEDTEPFQEQLREDAVNDALSRAEHYATLAGVSVGPLVFLSESSGGAPVARDFVARAAFAEAAPTPIRGGELELNLSVQVVFSIE
jgi:hypothetical protein